MLIVLYSVATPIKLVYKDNNVLWLNLISHLIMQCIRQENYNVDMHKKLQVCQMHHYYDYFCDRIYFLELYPSTQLYARHFFSKKGKVLYQQLP